MSLTCDIQPAFYDWSEPVARKQYGCAECHAPIVKGEKYFKATGKWDGNFGTHRQHLICCEACMMIRDKFEFECIPFGAMKEWLSEVFRLDPETKQEPRWKELRGLVAKIKWRERLARAKP